MLESKVESYFQKQVQSCGGMTLKFTSPSMRGVPDQIALYNGGVHFVEMKAPGEKPRNSQIVVHEIFGHHNVPVHTLDSIESVDDFITNVLEAEVQTIAKETFDIKKNMFDV